MAINNRMVLWKGLQMRKILLFIVLLTSLTSGQEELLLFDDGVSYNGTELITNAIDRGMEVGSQIIPDASSTFGTDGTAWWSVFQSTKTYNAGTQDMTVTYTTGTGVYGLSKSIGQTSFIISFNAKSSTSTRTFFPIGYGGVPTVYSNPTLSASYQDYRAKYTTIAVTTIYSNGVGAGETFDIDNIFISPVSNYKDNGNHKTDTSGVYKQGGSYSVKLTATAAGNGTTNTISLASTLFTAVTNGLNYRFQVYAYTSTANTTLTFKLGDIVKTAVVSTVGMSVINFDFKATASTTGNILLYLDKAATVYLDNISLRSGS